MAPPSLAVSFSVNISVEEKFPDGYKSMGKVSLSPLVIFFFVNLLFSSCFCIFFTCWTFFFILDILIKLISQMNADNGCKLYIIEFVCLKLHT